MDYDSYKMRASTPFRQAKGKRYSETFRCPGGALCLDFCNSGQDFRSPRGIEWIVGFDDLLDWLEVAKAMTSAQAARIRHAAAESSAAGSDVWARAIRIREALFRVLDARAAGRTARREDLALIEAEHLRAMSFARLSWNGEAFAWSLDSSASAPDAALQPIVESALRLLTSGSLARLRRCGNSTCFWLFLDETRNRSRRWCEMASCGNLLKVRRHREKARRHRH